MVRWRFYDFMHLYAIFSKSKLENGAEVSQKIKKKRG